MRYRVVHQTLDFMTEHSIPIGALIETSDGVRYLPRKLCEHCLTTEQRAVAEVVAGDLRAAGAFERVPDSCGPLISFRVARPLPPHWDAEHWVRFVVFCELEAEGRDQTALSS